MKIFLACVLFILPAFTQAQQKLFYVGKWQSNEEKTLASMRATQGIPEGARTMFANDFFGKLVNEFSSQAFTTYFTKQKPDSPVFIDANIVMLSENTIRITYFDEKRRQETIRELTFEDDCYSLLVTEWQFKEYFCRVK